MSPSRNKSVSPAEEKNDNVESDKQSPVSDGDDSDEESEEEEQVEWLAHGREKRSTAGNRLSSLLQQAEAEDDELNLLFEEPENEEDEGFQSSDENGSDVQMDSSDDDEDQGPAAGADDLEGEKELQRAERQSRKRKADDGIPKAFRKKRVKIDPTATLAPPPLPKKKSERVSWVPTEAEGPTRASSRQTTKESKEQLHAQMLSREKKRLKQLKNMEKSAAKREANKAKALTQEDRLKEAARIERQNARSLNKWEEAERLREEEQRQKLEDLHNRVLSGPVITYWSGVAEWENGVVKRVGKAHIEEKAKLKHTPGIYNTKKRRLEAAAAVEAEAEAAAAAKASFLGSGGNSHSVAPLASTTLAFATGLPAVSIVYTSSAAHTMLPRFPPNSVSSAQIPALSPLMTQVSRGVIPRPSLVITVNQRIVDSKPKEPQPSEGIMSVSNGSQTSQQNTPLSDPPNLAQQQVSPAASSIPPPRLVPSPYVPFVLTPAPDAAPSPASIQSGPIQAGPIEAVPANLPIDQQSPAPPTTNGPVVVERSTRNCIILENFKEEAVKEKAIQTQILFGVKTIRVPTKYKTGKITTGKDVACAITGYVAKYRDPDTGLPYFDADAFREIQRLKRGNYTWSTLLGAYVGSPTYAARGVPARFLTPKPVVKIED